MPKKQLALLVTIALLFGCAKAEIGVRPTAAQSVSYVSYTQPEGLFTMQIPSGWQVSFMPSEEAPKRPNWRWMPARAREWMSALRRCR